MDIFRFFEISGKNITADHLCHRNMQSEGFRLHSHDTYELIYVKTGSVTYLAEGRSYIVESGSCVLSRPGIYHTLLFRDSSEYERYAILLNSPIFDILPENLEVITPGSNPIISELFHKMDFYTSYLDGDVLESLLIHLIEEAVVNFRIISDSPTENYSADPIIYNAVTYINEHLKEPIAIEQLCEHLHITKSYLHRLFTKHLKLSPSKYITTKRLGIARMAIRAGSKPTQICEEFGFGDYCTFYRNYVKHFGYPPSEELSHPCSRKIEY